MTDYVPPTSEGLREILQSIGLLQSQTGKLADGTGNTVGKWSSSSGTIPYSVLFTLMAKRCNLQLSSNEWRDKIWEMLDKTDD